MTQTTIQKKITLATVKSFVKQNKENLFIKVNYSFDGMIDGMRDVQDVMHKTTPSLITHEPSHTMGIQGAWFVLSGGDYFRPYEDDMFKGIKVSNCCGNFILATNK